MGGKPFDTSGKAGRDENGTGDETQDGTSVVSEGRDGIDEANEATDDRAEDLTGRGHETSGEP